MRPRDMNEVEEMNRAMGGHWFDRDTKRFFGSRIGGTLYGGLYFISSEQDRDLGLGAAWNGQRRYTIREVEYTASSDGTPDRVDIGTVGTFGQYATRDEAIRAIREMLR